MKKTDLVVALDFPNRLQADRLIDKLQGLQIIYKVGLELFIQAGPDFVKKLTKDGHRVFLDLKLFDIPNTVVKAILRAAELEVEFVTIHLLGGRDMVKQSVDALKEMTLIGKRTPKILGVTVLTSFSDESWTEVSKDAFGGQRTIGESVRALTFRAQSLGTDGIVCSAHELLDLRKAFPDLYMMVPGIRPEGEAPADQARVMTPNKAAHAGANAVVVGRPITQNPNPRAVVESILRDLT